MSKKASGIRTGSLKGHMAMSVREPSQRDVQLRQEDCLGKPSSDLTTQNETKNQKTSIQRFKTQEVGKIPKS